MYCGNRLRTCCKCRGHATGVRRSARRLPLIVSINPQTTRADLQGQLDAKSNLLTQGILKNVDGLKLLQAKTTTDISGKAQECGIVKPDPVESFLQSIGSSQLAQYLPMVTSLSS